MRRRFLTSSVVVSCLALFASLGVHLPIYGALGHLAEQLLDDDPLPRRSSQVEFEIVGSDTEAEAEEAEAAAEAQPEPDPEPPPERTERSQAKPPPKPKAEPPPEPMPQPRAPKEPPKAQDQNKLAVTQKSDDPEVEPPPDARFAAEENRRVEEETVARVRNLQRDDPQPQVPDSARAAAEAPGNADRDEAKDLREAEGRDERAPTPEEAELDPPPEPTRGGAGDEHAPMAPSRQQGPRVAEQAPQAPGASSPADDDTVVIRDPLGTFRIPKPREGAAGPGGAESGEGQGAERPARRGRAGGPNLELSWSQFERAFGSEELEQQRQAYLEQRRSQVRGGGGRQKRWKQFRSAIENYVPNVRPGNQTALNAAASPFAAYLAAVHRRIHREFAERFLGSLPMGTGPYSDPSLYTKLEIVFERSGAIHRIGIVQTSGLLPFDYGAFEAVMRGQPYPEAPNQILSGDGRVYVHWGFYRNHRQCGTFNAEPFILPDPPGSAPSRQGPFQDVPPGADTAPSPSRHGLMRPAPRRGPGPARPETELARRQAAKDDGG